MHLLGGSSGSRRESGGGSQSHRRHVGQRARRTGASQFCVAARGHLLGLQNLRLPPWGMVRTPARESDAGHTPPNLYVAQEAQLRKRAEHSRWDYVALHPDLMVGDIYGNPMNIAMVISVFAELSHALSIPMRFPGTD